MSDTSNETPGIREPIAPSFSSWKKISTFSLTSILIGLLVCFGLYSVIEPFFCSNCFYIDSVNLDDSFSKLGYEREFIKDTIVTADRAIAARDLPRRMFNFEHQWSCRLFV
jgi:hypothetical protein